MQITFTLNHKKVTAEIAADTVLLDLVRSLGCKSVKRGCETANCGLCTVFLDEKPVLSCWRRESTAAASPRWRGCRRRLPSSAPLSPIRVRSSAASATRALL